MGNSPTSGHPESSGAAPSRRKHCRRKRHRRSPRRTARSPRRHSPTPFESAAPAFTTCKTSMSTFRAIDWWSSPAPADRARARWLSTRCLPKGSGNISKACRSMPGSSCIRSNGPTSTLIDGLQPTISIDQRAGSQNLAQHRGHGYGDLRLSAVADGPAGRTAIAPTAARRSASSRPSKSSTGWRRCRLARK